MAIKTGGRKLSEAELNAPDLDDDGNPDVETFPVPGGAGIDDDYLRAVWDEAVAGLDGETGEGQALHESKDGSGHEHKGKGAGGGQFVKGGGGNQNETTDKPIRPDDGTRPASTAHPLVGSPTPEHRATAARYAAASPGLSPETAATYTEHLSHALSLLPSGVAKHAGDALKHGGVQFHPDLQALRAQAVKLSGKGAAGVVGFARDRGMATDLHLDGGDDPRGTYVHELWHAADNQGFHSDDKGWQAAYKKDILKGKQLLSRYALTNASEGFAETGRVLAERGEAHMTQHYPNVMKHLKAKGLVGEKDGVSGAKKPETNGTEVDKSGPIRNNVGSGETSPTGEAKVELKVDYPQLISDVRDGHIFLKMKRTDSRADKLKHLGVKWDQPAMQWKVPEDKHSELRDAFKAMGVETKRDKDARAAAVAQQAKDNPVKPPSLTDDEWKANRDAQDRMGRHD